MIRPVALIVLALVGCQSADVQRAQPTPTIPATGGPTLARPARWRCMVAQS